jgi:hypothetical protein
LWLLVVVSLVFAFLMRFRAARKPAGKPQWTAIGIAFFLPIWVVALPEGGQTD